MTDKYQVKQADLVSVADAIRSKGGTTEGLTFPGGFVEAVGAIEAGGVDTLAAFAEGASEIVCNASFVVRKAFCRNESVEKATFPVATVFNDYAFNDATKIKEVYAPELTRAGTECFCRATKLEKIDAGKLLETGTNAFLNCSLLSQINCPNATTLNSMTFKNCTSLTELYAPNTTMVANECFNGCTSLQYVELGPLTKYSRVSQNTFIGCISLTAVVIRASRVLTLENVNAFSGTPIENGTGYIYFPSSLIPTFQAATNWSTLANQFRALEDYTVDGTVSGAFDRSRI